MLVPTSSALGTGLDRGLLDPHVVSARRRIVASGQSRLPFSLDSFWSDGPRGGRCCGSHRLVCAPCLASASFSISSAHAPDASTCRPNAALRSSHRLAPTRCRFSCLISETRYGQILSNASFILSCRDATDFAISCALSYVYYCQHPSSSCWHLWLYT